MYFRLIYNFLPHLHKYQCCVQLKSNDMYFLQHYVIDWSKVKTQDDIITILKELKLGFDNPSDELKAMCKLVNKSDGLEVTPD